MDFQTLQGDFFARGFQRLNDGGAGLVRAKRWLNAAIDEICEQADWPFLETTLAGAAPLTVSDLRSIESVMVTTTKLPLEPLNRHVLQKTVDMDLTRVGTPQVYYVTTGSAVNVYPVSTGSITVKYWKVPADLSANGDVAVIPSRFHDLIVECAAMKGYRYTGDYDGAANAAQEYARLLTVMRESLMDQQHDGPEQMQVTGASLDW